MSDSDTFASHNQTEMVRLTGEDYNRPPSDTSRWCQCEVCKRSLPKFLAAKAKAEAAAAAPVPKDEEE